MTKMQLHKEFNASQGEASLNVAAVAAADANVAAELRATATVAAATGVQWAQDVVVSQGLCHNSAIAPFSRTIKVPVAAGCTERKTRHSPAGLLCHTPSPPLLPLSLLLALQI